MFAGRKIVVVMPPYNAERTLRQTYEDVPKDIVDEIILVDDCSRDGTVQKAESLGIRVIRQAENRGYGGNQKTCYREALKLGADIVVMVHPDYQYNPKRISQLVAALTDGGGYDAAFGSRMLGKLFREGGMPIWKFYSNIILTAIANLVFVNFLTEYHSGFRAYTRKYLVLQRNVNLKRPAAPTWLSDGRRMRRSSVADNSEPAPTPPPHQTQV